MISKNYGGFKLSGDSLKEQYYVYYLHSTHEKAEKGMCLELHQRLELGTLASALIRTLRAPITV